MSRHLTSEEGEELSHRARERLRKATQKWLEYGEALEVSQANTKKIRAKLALAQKTMLSVIDTMSDPDDEGFFARDPKNPDADYVFNMRRKVSTRKTPINEKTIRSALSEMYEDPAMVDDLVAKIKSKQGSKEVVRITRRKKKRDQIDID